MGVQVYREWPGSFEIPGIGVPDPWAKRSSRKGGVNDGDPDLGQRSFGFSFLRYKFEIARLEGWEDFVRWERSGSGTEMDGGWLYPDEDDLMMWNEGNGSRERVAARGWVAARAGPAVAPGQVQGNRTGRRTTG